MAGIFDELAAAQRDPYSSLALTPATRVMTLLEQKQKALSSKMVDKEDRFDPNAALDAYDEMTRNTADSIGLLDLAEASAYRGAGNLADVGKDISNAIFGTEFDSSVETGYSNPELADQAAGVTEENRAALQASQMEVAKNVARGEWWDAGVSAIKAGPGTLADSANTLIELAVGTVAAPLAGSGTVLLGKKVADITKGAAKFAKMYDEAKDLVAAEKNVKKTATILSKGIDAVKKTGSTIGKQSLMTADIVQNQRNEYKAEHNEDPTTARLASMTLMTIATTALDVEILKRFFVPTLGRAKVFGKDGARITNATVKEQFVAEVKQLVNYAEEGALKSVMKTIVSGTGKVAKAGGAEGVQEYIQTWAEILGQRVGLDGTQSLMDSIVEEFQNIDNQDKAATGGLLGVGAGGTAKGIIQAPITVGKTVVHTGKGVSQFVGKNINAATRKVTQGYLTEKEREDIKVETKLAEAKFEELQKSTAGKVGVIDKAKTFADITDPAIQQDFINAAGPQADLSDPKVFEDMSNKVIGNYKAQIAGQWTDLQARPRIQKIKKGTVGAVKKVAALVDITPEDVDKAIKSAKKLGSVVIDDLKNFKRSGTYGITTAALAYGADASKTAKDTLVRAVLNTTPEASRKLAGILESSMPKTSAIINENADNRERGLKKEKRRRDALINMESLDPILKRANQAALKGETLEQSRPAVALSIMDATNATIEDMDTLNTLKGALKAYKDKVSKLSSTELLDSDLSPHQIARLEGKLEKVEKKLQSTVANKAKEVVKKTAEKADPIVSAAMKKVSEYTDTTIKALDELVDAYNKDEITWEGIKGKFSEINWDSIKEKFVEITTPSKPQAFKVKLSKKAADLIGTIGLGSTTIAKTEDATAEEKIEMYNVVSEKIINHLSKKTGAIRFIAKDLNTADHELIFAILTQDNPVIQKNKEYRERLEAVIERALKKVDPKTREESVKVDRPESAKDRKPGELTSDPNDDNFKYIDEVVEKNLWESVKANFPTFEFCKG